MSASKGDLVNAYLDSKVSQKDNLQGIVYEAMRYSLLAGGKRTVLYWRLLRDRYWGSKRRVFCLLPAPLK